MNSSAAITSTSSTRLPHGSWRARGLLVLFLGALGFACGSAEEPAPSAPIAPAAGVDAGTPATDDASPAVKACNAAPLEQEKGDCKRVVCDPNGTVVAINDDTDVPPADECVEFTCAGGKKVAKGRAAGTACSGGKCNGAGACVEGLGTKCTDNAACGSGFCVDGHCCNEACTGECKSCGNAGSEGICSNIPRLDPDLSYTDPVFGTPNVACTDSYLCDGNGRCLRRLGKTCAADKECLSGKCADVKLCYGSPGETCTSNGQCASKVCDGGSCK